MKMNLKKIFILILLFIINVLFLSSCVDVDIFINVNSDESGYINYSIAFDKEFYDNLSEDDFLKDIRDSFTSKNISFEELDKDDKHFIVFTYSFSDLNELSKLSNEIKRHGLSLSVDKINGIFKRTYLLNAFLNTSNIDLSLLEIENSSIENLSDLSELIDIEVRASLPGKYIYLTEPVSFNHEEDKPVWNVNFYDVFQIKALSEEVRTDSLILLISILFFVVVIIAILSYFGLKSIGR